MGVMKDASSGPLRLIIFIAILIFGHMPAFAQQKGQYLPGQQGLNAGILPDPGFTYANMDVNYFADTLKRADGSSAPLNTDYNIWAIENIFFYIPKRKFLGAKFAPYIVAPAIANGSLTLGAINFPNLTVNAGGAGIADVWVEPINLGWSLKRADINVGYAFVAPNGRYTPGASNNVGSGYWGNHITTGSTLYLVKNKGTSANLFTDWEAHGSKTSGAGTSLTPGQAFTMEWGLGQVLPLKKNFTQLLQVGVIGYDQWQLTDNGGFVTTNIPASTFPFYSVHAIGFQTTYLLPAKALNFFFKFEDEYRAFARPQGRTIVFGGTWTLRIPKPQPPAPSKP
jgi:hypothetical protein